MANAETYRGDAPFFPLQGPRVQRGSDVRIPADAANVEYPPISRPLSQSDEDAVWAQYEAMPPSTDDMKKASNVGVSRRWLIPAIVGAAFAVGIGYAALSDRPAAVEPALAANEAAQTDTSATALMGAEPNAGDPTLTTQSTFSSSQPTTVSPPPSSTAPVAATPEPAARSAPTPRAARPAPVAPLAEPPTPAPTYSRGEAPAAVAPAPAQSSDAVDPVLNPIPLPSAPAQEPALNLDLAPPAETVPAPGSVPENAQSPQ